MPSLQARQLDSMVRLTEARARADLREEATLADAEDVVELLKFCLRDFFRDAAPFVHVSVKGKGGKADGKRLMAALAASKRATGHDRASAAEIGALCVQLGIASEPQELIDGLNEAGELLRKGAGVYAF